jgi:hypothetical protein
MKRPVRAQVATYTFVKANEKVLKVLAKSVYRSICEGQNAIQV